jgi:peptidylprolyl isomerase
MLIAALALLSFGCGGDEAESTVAETVAPPEKKTRFPVLSDPNDPRFATVSMGEGRTEPEIDPADRAPPKSILVRDLEVGSGPIARPGVRVAVRYLGVDHRTGEHSYFGWLYPPALKMQLGDKPEAWEGTLWGMRAGGFREMIIPSRFAIGNTTLDYVVEMVRVEPVAKQ